MKNTLREFCDKNSTTLYKLAIAIQVSPSTLYRLAKHTESLPSPELMNKILNLYPMSTPNDLIKHTPDDTEVPA